MGSRSTPKRSLRARSHDQGVHRQPVPDVENRANTGRLEMEQATTNGDRRKLAVGLKAASTNPRIAIAPASLRLSGEYAAMVEESGGEPIILERGPRGFEQLKSSHGLIMTSITVVSG